MDPIRPDIEQLQQLGLARFNELNAIMVSSKAGTFANRFSTLSWIELEESIAIPLDQPEAFSKILVEFAFIIRELVQSIGFAILGYIHKLILNFCQLVDASYLPESRRLRINLVLIFLFTELENTFAWLSSLIISRTGDLSLNDINALNVPFAVKEELRYIYGGFNSGRLEYSYRKRFLSPIYDAIIRFVLSHEMGHLVYFAESCKLKERWQQTAWSDYEDALSRYAKTYNINQRTLTKLTQNVLDAEVANNWCLELIADGLAFHTTKQLIENEKNQNVAWQVLQIAVGVFYHTLAIAGDIGPRTHPPPLLREKVVMAQQRKNHGVEWERITYGRLADSVSPMFYSSQRTVWCHPQEYPADVLYVLWFLEFLQQSLLQRHRRKPG